MDDAPIFHIEGAIPHLLSDEVDHVTLRLTVEYLVLITEIL